MKTMKKGTEIVRVSEVDVKGKLNAGWAFCKKAEYKTIRGDARPVAKKAKVQESRVTKAEVAAKEEMTAERLMAQDVLKWLRKR